MNNSTLSTDLFAPLCVLPPFWMRIFAIVLCQFIFIVGGIGNVFTLAVFALRKSLRTTQNIYIICLTVSDTVLTTYIAVQYLYYYLSGCWVWPHLYCRAYVMICSVATSGYCAVALISWDRMQMVKLGTSYTKSYATLKKVWLRTVAFIILLPLAVNFIWINYDLFTGVNLFDVTGQCIPELLQNQPLYLIVMWSVQLGPLGVMFYCYAQVKKFIRKRVEPTAPATPGENNNTDGNKQHVDAARLLAQSARNALKRKTKIMNQLLAAVAVTSVPTNVVGIIFMVVLAYGSPATVEWWSHLFQLAWPMSWLCNTINPFLYANTMPAMREAMVSVLRKAWTKISSSSAAASSASYAATASVAPTSFAVPPRRQSQKANTRHEMPNIGTVDNTAA